MTNIDEVLKYVRSKDPKGVTNSEVVKATGITPHQQVFQITQKLVERGFLRVEKRGKENVFFLSEDATGNSKEVEDDVIQSGLSLERDLEEYIKRNLNTIENGLKLYDSNSARGQQVSLSIGRIDLLAIDKNNNPVVIELKAGTATYSVIGQVLSYIAAVKKEFAEGKTVRGIIIADDFEDRLKLAVTETQNIKLKKYKVNFEFEDVL